MVYIYIWYIYIYMVYIYIYSKVSISPELTINQRFSTLIWDPSKVSLPLGTKPHGTTGRSGLLGAISQSLQFLGQLHLTTSIWRNKPILRNMKIWMVIIIWMFQFSPGTYYNHHSVNIWKSNPSRIKTLDGFGRHHKKAQESPWTN